MGICAGGWANPVLEAMACGRAIVCTETPCNSDFVEHGINALVVKPGDWLGMRQWIDILLQDPPYVEMLAKAAYLTSRRYGYDTVVENLETAIFERLT